MRSDRITHLDVLRGIAITFICFANIPFFAGTWAMTDDMAALSATPTLDLVFAGLAYVLIDAKFYTIFSLLFGIGFAVQYANAQNKGEAFVPYYRRRMTILLGIGLIHLVFIWMGDILALYALIGFILILFRDVSDKTLLRWTALMLALPLIHTLFITRFGDYSMWMWQLADAKAAAMGYPMTDTMGFGFEGFDYRHHLTETDRWASFKLTMLGPLYRIPYLLSDGRVFKVLAMFIFGLWVGRRILNDALLQNLPLLRRVAVWGITIGLVVNLVQATVHIPWVYSLVHPLGVVPMAMGYAAGIALLVNRFPHLFAPWAAVGKTALSNYLMQSLVCIVLFYGTGFGWATRLSPSQVFGVAALIVTTQLVLSSWYVRRFQFGPVEWVWKKLTA